MRNRPRRSTFTTSCSFLLRVPVRARWHPDGPSTRLWCSGLPKFPWAGRGSAVTLCASHTLFFLLKCELRRFCFQVIIEHNQHNLYENTIALKGALKIIYLNVFTGEVNVKKKDLWSSDFILYVILKFFIFITSWFNLLLFFFILQEVKKVSSFTLQLLYWPSKYFTKWKHPETVKFKKSSLITLKYSNKSTEASEQIAAEITTVENVINLLLFMLVKFEKGDFTSCSDLSQLGWLGVLGTTGWAGRLHGESLHPLWVFVFVFIWCVRCFPDVTGTL